MSKPAPRISFVSLGCPKALVDSERIITQLRAEGYELTKSHEGADAVIVSVGVAELVPPALELVRNQGAVNLFAGFPPNSSIPKVASSTRCS
mgnify:CR=1 FL=1